MLKKKLVFLIISIISFFPINVFSTENKILLKIDNEIITSVDVLNEINFISTVNKNTNKISKEELYKISLNSLIKEKIKKIEILRNYKSIEVEQAFMKEIIASYYQKLGFKDIENFKIYLVNNSISFENFKNKIAIDSLWNEIIFFKFQKKIKIDKDNLRKQIIKKKDKEIKSYLLSEIVFNVDEKFNLESKYNQIKEDIIEKGFDNTALLHSISNTSNSGGDLGWINENSLNSKLQKIISKLDIGEITEPIIIQGGFLILKLNDTKKIKNKINVEKELKKLITKETNQQLNQLSNVYFNKVKKEIQINEI
ncbi:peptidylprolyl isomerase [Candidatus Pelagibacter sp.]|nr:peptidylprolyl isomerase [Candidatus Pelagibacter sp.]